MYQSRREAFEAKIVPAEELVAKETFGYGLQEVTKYGTEVKVCLYTTHHSALSPGFLFADLYSENLHTDNLGTRLHITINACG